MEMKKARCTSTEVRISVERKRVREETCDMIISKEPEGASGVEDIW